MDPIRTDPLTNPLTNPTVKAAIDALQRGDRAAWSALFEHDAKLYDDGSPRDLKTFTADALGHERFTSIVGRRCPIGRTHLPKPRHNRVTREFQRLRCGIHRARGSPGCRAAYLRCPPDTRTGRSSPGRARREDLKNRILALQIFTVNARSSY